VNRLVILSVLVLAVLVVAAFAYISSNSGRVETTSVPQSTTSTAHSTSTMGSGQNCASDDWTTYHGSNSRSGDTASTAPSAQSDWKSQGLDGDVYAEPVLCGENLIVGTENDTIYSLNATSGTVIWRTHLGTPMPGSSLPCGDIDPSGITGTPVIDATTGVIYAVAFETPGVHELVALNLDDGTVRFSRQVDPPGADPLVEQERGALSLANGMVYIPYGGLDGDCGDYHGWVVGINASGSGSLLSYEVQSQREAGIWAPSGAAVGSSGDLYVATGNGASNSQFDYGDSVIELSPTLVQVGYFAPTNWIQLNEGDTDLGSVGPLLLGNGDIFQIGKQGVWYLLNATNLGGIGGELYSGQVCSSVFGGTAAAGSMVFVPCTNGLFALSLSGGSFQTAWRSPGFSAGPPIVTGGTVWTLDTSVGTLYGYTVTTGGELYSFNVGEATRFTTPSFGDGRVYLAAGSEVFAFLLG
jgi:outer membrane protein assembly factor BamB